MASKTKWCVICEAARPGSARLFCDRCGKAYDRHNRESDGTVAELIRWVARRTRRAVRARLAGFTSELEAEAYALRLREVL